MEPPVRIERTTARLQGECSTTELRRPGLIALVRASAELQSRKYLVFLKIWIVSANLERIKQLRQ